MKKTIIASITTFFIGCASMYMIIRAYPLNISNINNNTNVVDRKFTVSEIGLSTGINNVYDSVVVVQNYKNDKSNGIGSGFIYNNDGYIMTNSHVIEGASNIKVMLMSGDAVDATIIGDDEYADIAVIKIDKKYVTKVATLGSSESINVGDTVFTIGSPISSEYYGTVTRGILSGKNRLVNVTVESSNDWIMNVMQTDAAINPGNSGGPLCNANGDVIGINSMKLVQSQVEGMGFAIPIEDAISYANMIVNGEKIKRSYLGLRMVNVSSTYNFANEDIKIDSKVISGVAIIEILKDGPCNNTGLKKGDVITKIGDYNIKTVAELRYHLYKYKPNDKINIVVNRNGKVMSYKVTLGISN
ncbi:MAG: trypsin-like peptidase domain-containing protein [Bacillales bacterium]|nr:trypsin-like peptidase domain-containing protein [Bacillales bacterium]